MRFCRSMQGKESLLTGMLFNKINKYILNKIMRQSSVKSRKFIL